MSREPNRVYSLKSEYMERYEQEQKRKRRRKRGLRRRLIAAGITMLLITAFVTHYHIEQRTVYSEKSQQLETLQSELEELEKVEAELLEEIELLKDESYILDIARTNYFLSKKGELIFQVEDVDSSY